MKCFNHHTDDAVGLCARCSRALCPSCATAVNGVLACKGRCEDDLRLLEESDALEKQQSEAGARAAGIGMGGFVGLMLAASGGFGLWLGWKQHLTNNYVIGGMIFGLGVLVLVLVGVFILQKKSVP